MRGKISRHLGTGLLAGLALSLFAGQSPARAEVAVLETAAFKLDFNLEASVGYFLTDTIGFGAGADGKQRYEWEEGNVKPGITAAFSVPGGGTLYGGWTLVGTGNRGDGAPWDVDNNGENFDKDELYAGWKSGTLFSSLGEDFLDLSYGQQPFKIGDGFLVWDGSSDGGGRANFWLAPHKSFRQAAVARINGKPVRADLFWLKSDIGETELAGLNLEYAHDKLGSVGAAYLQGISSESPTRDGMNVYDIRGQGTPFASMGLDKLTFRFEGALERNDESDGELKANAYYAEVEYEFALPWAPTLGYRYSHFSGDDPGTGRSEAFDTMFYGISRGWGTWYQGEIVGNYLLFSSNENIHMIHLKATPFDSLTLGAIYYSFSLDEPEAEGATASAFAREFNVYADWEATDWLFLSFCAGVASPGDAAQQIYGDDQDTQLFEMFATITF